MRVSQIRVSKQPSFTMMGGFQVNVLGYEFLVPAPRLGYSQDTPIMCGKGLGLISSILLFTDKLKFTNSCIIKHS